MGARHTRLAAAMAAAWEAELVSARVLSRCAEDCSDPRIKARLLVFSAFCRAHASRILARLSAMGRGPLPVPPEEIDPGEGDLRMQLRKEAAAARIAASRYEEMAQLARANSDLSSAWVCELNRGEEEDRARELLEMAGSEWRPSLDGAGLHA